MKGIRVEAKHFGFSDEVKFYKAAPRPELIQMTDINLETGLNPIKVIEVGKEDVSVWQSGVRHTIEKLSELQEQYQGRDEEAIVGPAAEEFAAEARNHPERYTFLSKWLAKEFSRRSQPLSVIDVGCGPGILTQQIATELPEATVLGVDLSPDMLRIAKQDNELDRVSYVHGDVRDALALAQRPADALLSRRMIHRVEGLETVLQRMASAVRADGGVMLNYSFRRPTEESGQRAFVKAASQRGDYKSLHAAFVRAVLNAPTLDEYVEACRVVGRNLNLSRCAVMVFPFDVGILMTRE